MCRVADPYRLTDTETVLVCNPTPKSPLCNVRNIQISAQQLNDLVESRMERLRRMDTFEEVWEEAGMRRTVTFSSSAFSQNMTIEQEFAVMVDPSVED